MVKDERLLKYFCRKANVKIIDYISLSNLIIEIFQSDAGRFRRMLEMFRQAIEAEDYSNKEI